MRITRTGIRVTLRDELSDAIAENLPRGDIQEELDSFCSSKEWEKLLDDALDVIMLHVQEAIKGIE